MYYDSSSELIWNSVKKKINQSFFFYENELIYLSNKILFEGK